MPGGGVASCSSEDQGPRWAAAYGHSGCAWRLQCRVSEGPGRTQMAQSNRLVMEIFWGGEKAI